MPAHVDITDEPINLVVAAGLVAGTTYRVQTLGVSDSDVPARAERRERICLAESAAAPDKSECVMLAGVGAHFDWEIDAATPLWAWVANGTDGKVGITEVTD